MRWNGNPLSVAARAGHSSRREEDARGVDGLRLWRDSSVHGTAGMSGYLKTLAKCLQCGDDTPIRRLRDAPCALCARCREVRRLLRCAGHKDVSATNYRTEAPKLEGSASAAAYLRAAAQRLEAAAYVLEAQTKGRGPTLRDARPRLAWALERARWGADMARNTLPLVQAERDAAGHGLIAVRGDGMPHEEPAVAPVLHLVEVPT